MNHDDNKNTANTLATELEARVVAWISGEASAFEAAELERLITDKPELAIFKRRMQAIQGLVAEAVRPEKDPLRLSPDRRGKLLQELGVTKADALLPQSARVESPIISLKAERRAQRKSRRWILAAAACVTLGLFGVMLVPNAYKGGRLETRMDRPLFSYKGRSENADYALAPPEAAKLQYEVKRREEFTEKKKAVEEAIALAEKRKQASSEERRELEGSGRDQRMAALAKMGREIADRAVQRQNGDDDEDAPARRGYQATNTLAGSRIRTEFKDIASAITVLPKESAGDIGAADKQALLQYASNTEAGGIQGNFVAPAAPASVGQLEKQVGSYGGKGEADKALATADEEKLVLSPFEVSSSKNNGYISKDTLAAKQIKKSGSLAEKAKSDDSRLENAPKPSQPAKKPNSLPSATEIITATEPVSTFSLHVSDVSFKVAKEALAHDSDLDRERIRPEEFYNAFNYGDPTPALNEKISCHIEQAAHPLMQQRNLVRIAMKVAAAGRGAGQPLRLTVLLDTSGSMEREDRVAAVRRAMQSLVSLLGPNDRVTLIGFARQPRLLAESVPGDQAGELLNIIANTPAEGGTNLEEALKLGREQAQRQFEETAQNRIVLLTDGAANLGNADREELATSIEESRKEGIAFDACGVGMEGLDDAMLEALSRKGDGRYYVLNSAEDADAGFARQLAGALRPAAKNVKLQVRFNPSRVRSYRLIGFEKHRLREEDFRNDKVDAAELAAEEAAVAVYQVEPLPQGEGELGEVFVRFLDPSTGNMVERSWTLPYEAKAPAFDRASPTMQLAGTAALLAETLQRGEKEDAARLNELMPIVKALPGHFPDNDRVDDLVTMFEQVKKLSAE